MLAVRAKRQAKQRETTGKSCVNCLEAFKVLCTCSRNILTHSTKTTQLSCNSVWQLTDNVHLATSVWSVCVFWIVGIPQFIVYLLHTDKYILHSTPTPNDLQWQGWMKMPSCVVPWLVDLMLQHDVSFVQKSRPANQKHHRQFMDICSQSQECETSKCWQCMFSLATYVPDVSTMLYEVLWRHCKAVFRTSFRGPVWLAGR